MNLENKIGTKQGIMGTYKLSGPFSWSKIVE